MQELSRGFTLYQRPPRGRYYMRYSIRGQGQQRVSLGTCDRDVAQKLAEVKWLKVCTLAEAGLSVSGAQFQRVAEDYIADLEAAVERGEKAEYHARQYPMILRKYLVGYFGKRLVSSIRPADIEAYWEWRKQYWITGPGRHNPTITYERKIKGRVTRIIRPVTEGVPSLSTLRKEGLLLRQFFDFARRHGHINEVPEFFVPKPSKRGSNARPAFTMQEFLHLKAVSEARVREYEDSTGKSQRVYIDRMKLHCFCMIAGFTGMRPTELFNLSWGDIDTREVPLENGQSCDVMIVQARGKGMERELAAMPEALTYFNVLRSLFYLCTGRMPADKDPVFFNREGVRIRSFKKGLAELLIAADLRKTREGKTRDSFSFRHFYITQQIREDVGHHLLGRNVGTSSKMIDKYYSKIRPTEEIAQLIPDWGKNRLLKFAKG